MHRAGENSTISLRHYNRERFPGAQKKSLSAVNEPARSFPLPSARPRSRVASTAEIVPPERTRASFVALVFHRASWQRWCLPIFAVSLMSMTHRAHHLWELLPLLVLIYVVLFLGDLVRASLSSDWQMSIPATPGGATGLVTWISWPTVVDFWIAARASDLQSRGPEIGITSVLK